MHVSIWKDQMARPGLSLYPLMDLCIPGPWCSLQLMVGCTAAEVRRAYRRLAAGLHPDKCSAAGAQDAFIKVTASYNTLLRRCGG